MGIQIVNLFEQAARVGGLRAKVRLAELTQTPTALATLVVDSDERVRDFEKALAQVRREFSEDVLQPPTLDRRIVDAIPEGGHLMVGRALLAERKTFIHDQRLTARRVTEAATGTLRIARAGVWLLDDAKSKITCVDLFESATMAHSSGMELFAKDFRPYFQAVATERILDAEDAIRDPRTSCFADVYLRPLGIASMMDVPLWSRGVLRGVLCCEHVGRVSRKWSISDKNFGFLLTQVMSMHYEAA
jgi:hypothetical protein